MFCNNVNAKQVMGEHNKRSSLSGARKPMSVTTTAQTPASISTPGGHSSGATNTSPTRSVTSQLPSQQMAATTSSGSIGIAASSSSSSAIAKDKRELIEIRQLLWGSNSRLDVFRRWSQG